MALTLDDIVTSPSPLGKQVWWTVSSDDPNIVKIKGNLSAFTDAVIILDPDMGETDVFTFDFQKILESNLGGYVTTEEGGHGLPTLDAFQIFDANEAYISVSGTFIELVSTASGGLVDGAGTSFANMIDVLNSFLPREQSQTFSTFDLSSSSKRFLTNNSSTSPYPVNKRKIKLTENTWLDAFDSTAHTDLLLKVAVTDVNGVETISYIDATSLATNDRVSFSVGPVNLNAATLDATYSAGVQPIIDSTTKTYTVQVVTLGSEEVTNGDFTSGTGWSLGSFWIISAGAASNGVNASGDTLSRTLSLSADNTYVVSTDLINYTGAGNSLSIEHNDTEILAFDADVDGTGVKGNTFMVVSPIANADIEIIATVSILVSIDDVSIKQVTAISEAITFKIDKSCNNKEVRFHWENRLGGLDSFTFKNKTRGISVNKKTYVKPLTKDFTNESRGTTTLGGESRGVFTVATPPLKDNDLIWLEEIFEDRATYIEENSLLIPVRVTRNSATTVEEGKTQLTINYEYANNRIILGK